MSFSAQWAVTGGFQITCKINLFLRLRRRWNHRSSLPAVWMRRTSIHQQMMNRGNRVHWPSPIVLRVLTSSSKPSFENRTDLWLPNDDASVRFRIPVLIVHPDGQEVFTLFEGLLASCLL